MSAVQRLARLARGPAAGAVIAQMWQAIGSFGLQLLAAWLLGATGLGVLSLCLSVIILATAVASGMVGDSAVVLDRGYRRIRAGLQIWTLILAAGCGSVVTVAFGLSGVLSPLDAVLFGAALVVFQLEELIRRLFMATLHYWRLVVVDSCAVLVALGVVGVAAAVHHVDLTTFFAALLTGQFLGAVLGILLLPAEERVLVPTRGAWLRTVADFGAWRGIQVSVAPAILTVMRLIVTAAAGAAVLGQIELARIYAAPALLAVQGLGSYLLSTYVRDRARGLGELRRRAWRAAVLMMAAAAVTGGLLAAVGPSLSAWVSGPSVPIDRIALVGWVLYVVAQASLQPFASLAAAQGQPGRVFAYRMIDAGGALVVLFVLLQMGVAASWTPFVLAGGLFLGGILVRRVILRPLGSRSLGFSTDRKKGNASYASR